MFAVIHLPDFALQAVLRPEPELRPQPVALVAEAGNPGARALLLEVNAAARAAGVVAGMTVPQAQARCRELLLKPRSALAEQGATEVLLQTAYAFSPHLEHTAPGVGTIDLRGLSFAEGMESGADLQPCSFPSSANSRTAQQSFEFLHEAAAPAANPRTETETETAPLRAWAERIVQALAGLHLEARVGVAATPDLARLAAGAAQPVLVLEQREEFLGALPVAALGPSAGLGEILRRWGIHTAGAFLALGRDAVAERLGAEALALFARAEDRVIRPLNIVVPGDVFEERMEFEVPVETAEPLLFVLRRFVEQLAARVALTYRVVAELRLELVLESGAGHGRDFRVPAPTANVETLFRMLHTHLETLRTETSITAVKLGATPARAGARQFALFEPALRDPNHFHETLARLTALLGAERVGTPELEATHRPDAFRMRTPQFGERPREGCGEVSSARHQGLGLRRFRPALHADVELDQGRPAFIRTLTVSGAVRRVRGPWCQSGQWWDQRRWARQEWDVETRDGALYRLFQADGDWRVEGVYD